MIILVLNCGSSSLKYQVLDMKSESDYSLLAKGLVERIGLDTGEITHSVTGKDKYKIQRPISNHTSRTRSHRVVVGYPGGRTPGSPRR